jgi:hypothetical protein
MQRALKPLVAAILGVASGVAAAESGGVPTPPEPTAAGEAQPVKDAAKPQDPYTLVEEFTASTLSAGELKIGTDLEVGLTDDLMIGTDLVAAAIGAPSLSLKVLVYDHREHQLALGVRGAFLNRKTVLWGSAKEHFYQLDARIVRPSISWTNVISPRLKLHTFWAKGFGKVHAVLSDKGRRKLWETKHPGGDYDAEFPQDGAGGGKETGKSAGTSGNQATDRQSSFTQQSVQVQSITGLAQDRFQMTGEIRRANGNKVLLTCRIEDTQIEDLKSNSMRLTVAHQWIWSTFQMRLGVGVQYLAMSGHDLDGESIDEAGTLPASDIGFYWRF